MAEALALGGEIVTGRGEDGPFFTPTIILLPRAAVATMLWSEESFAPLRGLRAARVIVNEDPLYQDPHFVVGGVGNSGLFGARPKLEQLVYARRVHFA